MTRDVLHPQAVRISKLHVGQSAFVLGHRGDVNSRTATAKRLTPGSAYRTEAREGGYIVTRTA